RRAAYLGGYQPEGMFEKGNYLGIWDLPRPVSALRVMNSWHCRAIVIGSGYCANNRFRTCFAYTASRHIRPREILPPALTGLQVNSLCMHPSLSWPDTDPDLWLSLIQYMYAPWISSIRAIVYSIVGFHSKPATAGCCSLGVLSLSGKFGGRHRWELRGYPIVLRTPSNISANIAPLKHLSSKQR
ncbi:hypothetical protein J6590_021100, partial [Homalodisca vitripennis]